MRNVYLFWFMIVAAVLLIVETAETQGHSHPAVYVPIVYSDGITPVLAMDLTFVAYIDTRPREQLTETSTGSAVWDDVSGAGAMVDCEHFPTFWSIGEILIMEITGAGSNYTHPETGVFTLELNNDDPQYAYGNGPNGEFILSGEGWLFEVVDSLGNVGRATSLALDGNGAPHISYVDYGQDRLMYAWRSTAGWHIDVVDGSSIANYNTSLALAADGTPRIAYVSNGDQKYAYRDDTGWHIERVSAYAQPWISLALDSRGLPHTAGQFGLYACEDDTTSDRYYSLQYAHKSEFGWQVELVEGGNLSGVFCSIAVDEAGYPHIVHWDTYDPNYCWKDATGWHVEVFADGPAYDCSLELDGYGFPHVSYSTGSTIEYARHQETGWSFQTVDTEEGGNFHTSLELDDLTLPHITYCNWDAGDLRYAFFDGDYWWIQTVVDEGNVGQYNSLALDSLCRPHISYRDETNADLVYARLIPSTNVSGTLVGQLVYLTWSVVPGAAEYWVYGAPGYPFYLPDLVPPFSNRLAVLPQGSLSWISPNPSGSPGYGWTYLVFVATASGQEVCTSNRVGEATFSMDIRGQ